MAIKITYGGSGQNISDPRNPLGIQQQSQGSVATPTGATLQQAAPALAAKLSDAAVTSIRQSKLNPVSGEQIRDYPTARKTADSVSEQIRERSGESLDAHGSLGTAEAREHLVSQ